MEVATKARTANAAAAKIGLIPKAKSNTAVATPVPNGKRKFRAKFSAEALRHPMSGQMPMSSSKARKIGPVTSWKKGGPTVVFTPRTASERRGNTDPQKMAKAAPTRRRLFSRKLD